MMAEMEGEGLGSMPTKRKLSGKKMLIFVLLPLILIGGAAAALWFTGILPNMMGGGTPAASTAAAPSRDRPSDVVWYTLPDLLVNLRSDGPRPAFLRLKVNLELGSVADRAAIEKVMPRVLDTFQVYLRELRPEQLQGAAGMFRLREELLARVNAAVRPTMVRDVLFTEIVVQ